MKCKLNKSKTKAEIYFNMNKEDVTLFWVKDVCFLLTVTIKLLHIHYSKFWLKPFFILAKKWWAYDLIGHAFCTLMPLQV